MKNSLKEFSDLLSSGKYFFHFHTDYTDGSSNVRDYFNYVSKKKFKSIVFTEHVRKNIAYDFDNFLNDIRKMERVFPMIKAVVGVESRVFPNGEMDIPDSILSEISVVCFACHSFPDDINLYRTAFKKIFTDKRWRNYIRVWVHPGSFIKRTGFSKRKITVLEDLIETAVTEGVFIEDNLRHRLLPDSIMEKVPSENLIVGYDAHSVEDLNIQ